jgi:tagaturonate reductase
MMQDLNRQTTGHIKVLPERILQFGGGNFLRGFVDWIIDVYNTKTGSELGILVIKPTAGGDYKDWRDQDGLYHVLTKGIRSGEVVSEQQLVSCISRIIHPYDTFDLFISSAEQKDIRYIVSNTTESGLRVSPDDQITDQPPTEFPAKLTVWLYHRFRFFKGADTAGCVILPTELLTDNGTLLKECILANASNWGLESAFINWVESSNTFCNTLVDRIVPGVSRDDQDAVWKELGFRDTMVTQGEPYHLWVIEAPAEVRMELPLDKIGLNILYTEDLTPYRTQKVRILNGAHILMVPVGLLCGMQYVRESMEDPLLGGFVRGVIYDEIIPTLEMPVADLEQYAKDVLDRFANPFIEHQLMSIALNAVSKFKARILPSLLTFQKRTDSLPERIILALAALIRFYKGEWNNTPIALNDEPWVIAFFREQWSACDGSAEAIGELVRVVLSLEKAWGTDLMQVPGLHASTAAHLIRIEQQQLPELIKEITS